MELYFPTILDGATGTELQKCGFSGGGCAEAGLVQTAREVMRSGSYQFCKVDMTGEVAEEEGMVCGGWMMVVIEAL